MDRRIAHLDIDAFYASVELQHYPQLQGLPMVGSAAVAEGGCGRTRRTWAATVR